MDKAGAMVGLSPIVAKNMTPEQAEARKLATFLETGQTLAGTFELKEALSRILATPRPSSRHDSWVSDAAGRRYE